ncbi:MAG: hypothetical protein QG632_89 [Candidatus Dependentiae bacterium]|nr:hypothetical protein [Candidatus Dependentiae bacterium]
MRLQQILALKSFGFGLTHIKKIVDNKLGVAEQLTLQQRFLEKKAQSLIDASTTLKNVLAELGGGTTVAWETIIKLIEVYNMTNELKKSWVGEVMNERQLKEYAEFTKELKSRFTEEDRIAGEAKWAEIADRIRQNLYKAPSSEFGIEIAKECIDIVNSIYGKRHALRKLVWEEGYKKGHFQWAEPVVIEWYEKAKQAYYHFLLIEIVNQAGVLSSTEVTAQWGEVIAEMWAEDKEVTIAEYLLCDQRLNEAGRKLLQELII